MSDDNFYKTPDAELAVDNSEVDEFFPVSTTKFWIMHVLTFGLYDFYWAYRHWDHIRMKHGLSLWPAVRGFFYWIMAYALFKRVQESATAKPLDNVPNLKLIALCYYVLLVVQAVGSAVYDVEFAANPWVGVVFGVIINVLMGFTFVTMQRTANRVIDDPEGRKNSRVGAINIVWIVVILLLYGLGTIGSTVQA